jgi:hypothetical protein
LKYSKTIVFTCLGNEYFSFGEYFILGKKRSGLKSPIRQKNEVLEDTSVLKLKYLLDPNALKYLILHYF